MQRSFQHWNQQEQAETAERQSAEKSMPQVKPVMVDEQPVDLSMSVQQAFPEELPRTRQTYLQPQPQPKTQPKPQQVQPAPPEYRPEPTAPKNQEIVPETPVYQQPVLDEGQVAQKISRDVSRMVMAHLNDETTIDRFLHARELENDNRQLAYELKRQLTEQKELKNELDFYKKQLQSFKSIAGNVYLKLD